MAVPGCQELLDALHAAAVGQEDLLFGPCGGLSYAQCVESMAKTQGSLWRESVRAKMRQVFAASGPDGDAQAKQLATCLAAGVDALTGKVLGVVFWLSVFDKDRPDAGAAAAAFARGITRTRVVADASRAPLPIDPGMARCAIQGGIWNPSTGKCSPRAPHFPGDDEGLVGGDAAMEGECVAAGGQWDSAKQTCVLPMPPEMVEAGKKAGLYLALAGLGIIALTGTGIYLATRR